MTIIELCYIIFAVCAAILAWTYALFPLTLRLLRPFYRPVKKDRCEPAVSIILPTYNEESTITKKIENTQWLEYPEGKKEIIVVDSDSTDRTVDEAMKFKEVKIVRESVRLGKSHALNTALRNASGDIVLITDVDSLSLRKDALLKMSENFADSSVGAVAAPIVFSESKQSLIRKGIVRNEKGSWVRLSLLDSIPTGYGEFLSFRRNLVQELDLRCLSDDIDISMQVRRRGYRVIAEPDIEIVESTPLKFREWYKQIVRRKLNGYTSLWHKKSMLFNYSYGWYGMMILPTSMLFHNLSPFLLLACLFTGFALNMSLPPLLLAVVFISSVFSSLVRKFLIVQLVDLNAWGLFLLHKHNSAWEKEEHSQTQATSMELA